jgi:Mn-dependent DtxR family transcriptional regulator
MSCTALPVAPYTAAEFLRDLAARGIVASVVDGKLELRGVGLSASQREEARLVADTFGAELLMEVNRE